MISQIYYCPRMTGREKCRDFKNTDRGTTKETSKDSD